MTTIKENLNETLSFASCSPVAALSSTVTLRVLSAGEVCSDGGLRRYGFRVLWREKTEWAVVFGALALLFQPLLKISLGRIVWNIVDVVVAVLLLVVWFKRK